MPSSNRQPPAEHELAWLLHSATAWALTGALMTVARRPLWDTVGVVLTVLGIGVAGWVVQRRLRQQPPRQQTNGIFPHRSSRPGHMVPRAVKERAMSVLQPDPESGQPTASDLPAFQVVLQGYNPAQVDAYLPQLIARLEDAEQARAALQAGRPRRADRIGGETYGRCCWCSERACYP